MAKKPKLGSGERFKQLKGNLAAKGATNPGALAAYIGRKKYGASKFAKLSAGGKKREPEKGESKKHEKSESKSFEAKEKDRKYRPTKGKGHANAPFADKKKATVGPVKTQNKLVEPKPRVKKRSPFANLGKDEHGKAGKKMYDNVLSSKSKQNRLHTGKSLLKAAKGK